MKRFFVYQSPINRAHEARAGVYTPTCQIRDRQTLVTNPCAPKYKMYAIVEKGLRYLEALQKTNELNKGVDIPPVKG